VGCCLHEDRPDRRAARTLRRAVSGGAGGRQRHCLDDLRRRQWRRRDRSRADCESWAGRDLAARGAPGDEQRSGLVHDRVRTRARRRDDRDR
jgi:hypothetical protein